MEKEFCTYTQALRLKALGFDEPCFATYLKSEFLGYPEVTLCLYSKENIELGNTKNSNRWISLPECCSAPTFSQAFRWFREKHDLACYIYRTNFTSYEWVIDIDESYAQDSELDYTSYEKAELACLEKLLEIVESKSE